ncbi:MAG: hypothetical protein EOT05_01275 [Candidatus Microsaccharimonas sossegonensis]|uniref:TrbC/VIRB2 family protein n=1 Tax=Candidatus Microsaccharimonas sossegonensis TaxID=2506948 RepID=A0A4Q0AHE0_9BACT|nr:MAG: hypothetical protein EOT05_01275 [Candidatus Microsaccharimonas sossegonensis]
MKKLRNLVMILGIAVGVGVLAPAVSANAANVIANQCAGVTNSAVCKNQNAKPNDLIAKIVNTLLFVVGALAVIMIIVGGLLYATSSGDPSRVTMAKNTLMYAIIGLVVAFLAFAVVNFVIVKFTK